MNIHLVAATGHGTTKLSAFDSALCNAGVYNYNLIRLSSVIPPNSIIQEVPAYQTPPEEYGHRLYVVYAEIRTALPKEWAGAVVGWYQLSDGRGVFVEHEATGQDGRSLEQDLIAEARASVTDLCRSRGYVVTAESIHTRSVVAQATDKKAASALAIAVYKSQSWEI